MFPSSPIPHDTSPEPLYRSPSSLANVSYNARRRRRRLVSATSDNDAISGADSDGEAHGVAGVQQQGSSPHRNNFQLSSSSTGGGVTMLVGLANWRRMPKSSSSQQERNRPESGASGISSGSGSRLNNPSVSTFGSAGAEGASSRTSGGGGKRSRKMGLGMGMKGTPATKGYSKSKSRSNSRSIGMHSTPIAAPRQRSRSGSHTSFLGSQFDKRSASNGAIVDGSSSSLSSLLTIHSTTDDELPTPPSDLDSPDRTIPTIPNRQPSRSSNSRKPRSARTADVEDVFSASYVPVRRLRRPPGVPRSDIDDSEREYDRLIQMAEEEEVTVSLTPTAERLGKKPNLDEAAIRDKMFPGMIDMLWPVVSSSDLPSSEQSTTKDVEYGDSRSDMGSGSRRAEAFMDFEVPVKGTPYRVGVASTANTALATAKAPRTNSSGGTQLPHTPVPKRMLKSAMKGSKLSSPVKTPMPRKSSLRQTPHRAHQAKTPSVPTNDLPETDNRDLTFNRSHMSRSLEEQKVTDASASRAEVVFSFDQPLRGSSPSEPASPIGMPGITGDSTPKRRVSIQRTISNRPKTPAALQAFIARNDYHSATDSESTALSTPLYQAEQSHVRRSHESDMHRRRLVDPSGVASRKASPEAADQTVVLEKRPLLNRTLSQLLQSEDEDEDGSLEVPAEGKSGAINLTRGHARTAHSDLSLINAKQRTKVLRTGTGTKLRASPDDKNILDRTLSQLLRSSSQTDELSSTQKLRCETGISVERQPVSECSDRPQLHLPAPRALVKDLDTVQRRNAWRERTPDLELSRSAHRPLETAARLHASSPLGLASEAYHDVGDAGDELLGDDDDDEYEALDDIAASDYGDTEAQKGNKISFRSTNPEDYLPPAPWTPSSHRGSPTPPGRTGWYQDRASSPLTFSRSASPFERLLTPPPISIQTGSSAKRKSAGYQGHHRKKRRDGAWKGREVLQRMEEADREEAAFWLLVRADEPEAIQAQKKRKRRNRVTRQSDEEGVESDEGSERDRRPRRMTERRKRLQREAVLLDLYGTEVGGFYPELLPSSLEVLGCPASSSPAISGRDADKQHARAAMEARKRHYAELQTQYDMAVETVW